MLNPPVAIPTATAIPNTPTSASPGYLIKIRTPSLTSNHQESSARNDCKSRARSAPAGADRKTESRRRKRHRIDPIFMPQFHYVPGSGLFHHGLENLR